jgi:hypothetical protein
MSWFGRKQEQQQSIPDTTNWTKVRPAVPIRVTCEYDCGNGIVTYTAEGVNAIAASKLLFSDHRNWPLFTASSKAQGGF